MSNLKTVQEIYAAFGAGDVPSNLSKLADDVDWEYGPGSTDVPWLQHRSGRAAVGGFFESSAHWKQTSSRPRSFSKQATLSSR